MRAIKREAAVTRLFLAAYVVLQAALLAPTIALPQRAWAIVLLIAGISLSVGAIALSHPLSLRFRIIALVISYLGLTTVFGSIHFLLFLSDPQSYTFADNISLTQRDVTLRNAAGEIDDVNNQLSIVSASERDSLGLSRWLTQHDSLALQNLDTSMRGLVETACLAPAGCITVHTLRLARRDNVYFISGDLLGDPRATAVRRLLEARTNVQWRQAADLFRASLFERRRVATDLLSKGHAEWGYPEFLYLSVVTITTVGFGDIVPATRSSRLLVSIEAMAGVLLLGFALVFFWPGSKIGENTLPN